MLHELLEAAVCMTPELVQVPRPMICDLVMISLDMCSYNSILCICVAVSCDSGSDCDCVM